MTEITNIYSNSLQLFFFTDLELHSLSLLLNKFGSNVPSERMTGQRIAKKCHVTDRNKILSGRHCIFFCNYTPSERKSWRCLLHTVVFFQWHGTLCTVPDQPLSHKYKSALHNKMGLIFSLVLEGWFYTKLFKINNKKYVTCKFSCHYIRCNEDFFCAWKTMPATTVVLTYLHDCFSTK